jgi:hypothetical protein
LPDFTQYALLTVFLHLDEAEAELNEVVRVGRGRPFNAVAAQRKVQDAAEYQEKRVLNGCRMSQRIKNQSR